jgi:hypothetical protein
MTGAFFPLPEEPESSAFPQALTRTTAAMATAANLLALTGTSFPRGFGASSAIGTTFGKDPY